MSKDTQTHWPPLYQIKKSVRARHVRLKASVDKGLELIVPLRFNPAHVPMILEKHKSWIEKKLADLDVHKQQITQQPLPKELALPAIHESWRIDYIETNHKKLQLVARPHQTELAIIGNLQNITGCKKLLATWLKNHAKTHLTARLDAISLQTGLSYKNLIIRSQQTRWGSCSSDQLISLNMKLLFLPEHLATHIMIHELCHTIHMNHSPHFWQLVASFDVHWQTHRREARHADKWIPTWFK